MPPSRTAVLACLMLLVAWGCRPEADVPPGEDVRDLPTASEPLGGQTRDGVGAEGDVQETVPAAAPSTSPADEEPASPLRPAPGGSED